MKQVAIAAILAVVVAIASSCGGADDNAAAEQAALVEQGKLILRFDAFGDEAHWTDTLRMHEVPSPPRSTRQPRFPSG
jgi:hypothetical protein